MSYYFSRFMFLFCVACTLLGMAYLMVNVGFGNHAEASKSLVVSLATLIAAMAFHQDADARSSIG